MHGARRSAVEEPTASRAASWAGGSTDVGGGARAVDVVTSLGFVVNGHLSIAKVLKLWC